MTDSGAPSQLNGQLTSVQGGIYETIGNVTGAESWKTSGQQLQAAGSKELEQAKFNAKADATVDKAHGKLQSAYGMAVGDHDKQNEGNVRAEKANIKQAAASRELPALNSETVKGKLESAVGMATGDQDKQNKGNIRAEKGEWTGK